MPQRLADDADAVRRPSRAIRPDHLATLIYTSGTTGRPKGVRLTPRLLGLRGRRRRRRRRPVHRGRRAVPLAAAVALVRQGAAGGPGRVGSPTAVDGRIEKIVDNLAVVTPDVHGRRAAHLREGLQPGRHEARGEGGLKQKIFEWAMGVGREVSRLQLAGQGAGRLLAFKLKICRQARVHQDPRPVRRPRPLLRLGLGAALAATWPSSSTRPASSSSRATASPRRAPAASSTARQVRVRHRRHADARHRGASSPRTARSCSRGPGRHAGLPQPPRATAEALDADGWLHTGDIGELDGEGFLRITDRKKDLIKTSGGKYVAPQAIEGSSRRACPFVSQIVVHGDKRNFVTALVTLDEDALTEWASAARARRPRATPSSPRSGRRPSWSAPYFDERQRQLAKWETVKTVRASSKRPHGRGGRAHAEPQGQAQGRREGTSS